MHACLYRCMRSCLVFKQLVYVQKINGEEAILLKLVPSFIFICYSTSRLLLIKPFLSNSTQIC